MCTPVPSAKYFSFIIVDYEDNFYLDYFTWLFLIYLHDSPFAAQVKLIYSIH